MAITESNLGKYPYVTLVETKDYLSINSTTHDGRLANVINYACGVVEHYIEREVLANNYSETFDGGYSSVFTSRLPLANVHSVFEYDGTRYESLNPPAADGLLVDQDSDNHTITTSGDAHLVTRVKKFGQSSMYFDGDGDFLTAPNGDDWWFDTGDFTIDVQARFASFSTSQVLVEQYQDANDFWQLRYNAVEGLQFRVVDAGTEVMNVAHAATSGYTANTFHHLAVSKSGTSLKLFRDGGQIGSTVTIAKTVDAPNFSGDLLIAKSGNTTPAHFTGYMDELRISKTAHYTGAFTAPEYQHLTDDETVLLLHFEGSNAAVDVNDTHASQEEFVFKKDTGEISRNTGSGAGYQKLTLHGPKTFQNFPQAVRVNYRAGYESGSVPQDLKLATLDYIKLLHKEEQDRAGFALAGESVTRPALTANFPPHIKRVLDLYRIIE